MDDEWHGMEWVWLIGISVVFSLFAMYCVNKDRREESQKMAKYGYVKCAELNDMWVKSGECPAYQVRGK